MIERTGHIISKFSWNTSFDSKEKVPELQDRLSVWSRMKMPVEITGVFDKLCPSEQFWQIGTLEVDLGMIDFNDLEHELNTKLPRQLEELLNDLILHPGETGSRIEILNGEVSLINMIGHFLLHGLLPWSKKPGAQSINQLMDYLLQHENKKMIGMLREIGVRHPDARKRIAWQFSETSIIRIIEGLEPSNHTQVIDLSKELVRVQAKESIVQTGMPEFKKNIWVWILNYLLAERGTVFNKIAFIESSIRQMAGYYNISYHELLTMIDRAVGKVEQHSVITADVILVLRILIKEDKTTGQEKRLAKETEASLWNTLEKYFRKPAMRSDASSTAAINDLIISLARLDKQKFRVLLLSLEKDGCLTSPAFARLDNASGETLFSVFSDNDGVADAENIYFLDRLLQDLNMAVETRVLWEAGLKFLTGKKAVSFDQKEFLDAIITEISRQKHLGKLELLEKLICTEISYPTRTLAGLTVYNRLTAVFIGEVTQTHTSLAGRRFEQILTLMDQQLSAGAVDKKVFAPLQKLAIKYARYSPAAALRVLVGYSNKAGLRQMLPYLLEGHLTRLLVNHAENEASSIMLPIQQAAESDSKLADLVDNHLPGIALHAAVFHPALNGDGLAGYILKKLTAVLPALYRQQFNSLIEMLAKDDKINIPGLSIGLVNKVQQSLAADRELPVIEAVGELIGKPYKQDNVARLLSANFSDKQFTALRRLKSSESNTVLNYLLTGGARLRDGWIVEYSPVLSRQLTGVSKERIVMLLDELYWKCILNYQSHRGNAAAVKRQFEAAVWFRFPGKTRKATTNLAEQDITETYGLKNGERLSFIKLTLLIGQCLENNRPVISYEGKAFRLNELMVIGLEAKPHEIRQIVKKMPLSDERIKMLLATVSFSRFSLLIANDAYGPVYESVKTIRVLYELIEHLAPARVAGKLLSAYWKLLLQVIKTDKLTTGDLQKLVQDSMHYLAWEMKLDPEFIHTEVRKRSYRLTPELRGAFTGYNTALALTPTPAKTSIARKAARVMRKGLLYELAHHIITQRQFPPWLGRAGERDVKDMLNEIAARHTVNILLVLKRETVSESQFFWLSQAVDFKVLIMAISDLNNAQQLPLENLEKLYELFGRISIRGMSAKEARLLVFRKLIKAWATDNWTIISAGQIWNELAWSMGTRSSVQIKQFAQAMEKARPQLPVALQISFEQLKDQTGNADAAGVAKAHKKLSPADGPFTLAKEGIPVKNAGLVLVNNYLPVLLERLGITNGNVFVDTMAQLRAVHYLQYVVTGFSSTEEFLLPLNKILCGLPLSQPVEDGILITEEEAGMIDGLIEAMISHWPAIGASTVYGFRGNWLVRDGLLIEQEERWELTVEKRAYDVLINHSPFSFSIIKYPWMKKPLHVTWPY